LVDLPGRDPISRPKLLCWGVGRNDAPSTKARGMCVEHRPFESVIAIIDRDNSRRRCNLTTRRAIPTEKRDLAQGFFACCVYEWLLAAEASQERVRTKRGFCEHECSFFLSVSKMTTKRLRMTTFRAKTRCFGREIPQSSTFGIRMTTNDYK